MTTKIVVVTDKQVKRVLDIVRELSPMTGTQAELMQAVQQRYLHAHGEHVSEDQVNMAAGVALASAASEPQERLCHCGTCAEAARAAHRLLDQTMENQCAVWVLQLVAALILESFAIAEALAEGEGTSSRALMDHVVASMEPHKRAGKYDEGEWKGPVH